LLALTTVRLGFARCAFGRGLKLHDQLGVPRFAMAHQRNVRLRHTLHEFSGLAKNATKHDQPWHASPAASGGTSPPVQQEPCSPALAKECLPCGIDPLSWGTSEIRRLSRQTPRTSRLPPSTGYPGHGPMAVVALAGTTVGSTSIGQFDTLFLGR
jgi:hypothetical protein